MTEPKENPPKDALYITIAGKEWPIPKRIGPKYMRTIVPRIIELMRHFGPMFVGVDAKAPLAARLMQFGLEDKHFDLFGDVVHCALSKLHPEMKRDEFDELETDINELVAALTPIMESCGLFNRKEEQKAAGERSAETETGTSSSTT